MKTFPFEAFGLRAGLTVDVSITELCFNSSEFRNSIGGFQIAELHIQVS
jgi:hypothetical protein